LKFPISIEDQLYEGGYNWVSGVDENPIIYIPWKNNWTKS
jgi:hypothetical protein